MKERLDVLLVKQGFAPSREKAKAILMSGIVYVDGQKEDKAGTMFDPEKIKIEVRGNTLPYVSRGGLKLEKALQLPPLTLMRVKEVSQTDDVIKKKVGRTLREFEKEAVKNMTESELESLCKTFSALTDLMKK